MATKTAILWDNPLFKNITVAGATLKHAIWKVVQYEANDGQNFMRQNAPWTDRTGNARQGLFARGYKHPDGYVIVYYHTVSYGIWLEVAKGGKYRIIEPTVQQAGPKIMESLQVVMRSIDAAGGMSA